MSKKLQIVKSEMGTYFREESEIRSGGVATHVSWDSLETALRANGAMKAWEEAEHFTIDETGIHVLMRERTDVKEDQDG